jgi:proteasome assembly chaperone (PAC2) family protein
MKGDSMRETFVNLFNQPKIKNPILIAALPGIGNLGKNVAQQLIEFSCAKLSAELYSPSFPDFVFIDKNGICKPPRYEFYVSPSHNLIILTGEIESYIEEVAAQYEVCGKILKFIKEVGCIFVITIEEVLSHQSGKIHIAGTSKDLVSEYSNKNTKIFGDDRIVGTSGVLLGLAKISELEGICLLISTKNEVNGKKSSQKILNFLKNIIKTKFSK